MRLRLTREENFDGLGSSRLEAHPGSPGATIDTLGRQGIRYGSQLSPQRSLRRGQADQERLPNHEVAWSVYGSSRTRGQDPCIGIRAILR